MLFIHRSGTIFQILPKTSSGTWCRSTQESASPQNRPWDTRGSQEIRPKTRTFTTQSVSKWRETLPNPNGNKPSTLPQLSTTWRSCSCPTASPPPPQTFFHLKSSSTPPPRAPSTLWKSLIQTETPSTPQITCPQVTPEASARPSEPSTANPDTASVLRSPTSLDVSILRVTPLSRHPAGKTWQHKHRSLEFAQSCEKPSYSEIICWSC